MSTLPPPFVNEFPKDSLEKKVYSLVESLAEYLPVPNDRNRLGYTSYKYMTGEGDPPLVMVKAAKVTLKGISVEDFAKKLEQGLNNLK